ncbi:MAG: hypothetical protein CMB80_20160 [Flammeovirgaceae bacterium]|nr:hypothetical protein [Flammeovirgaceae bacterium]MBE61045.1 hypothetical protein [Flammeovirgaceae bacterium]MBR08374.1 hypothetical protein [Rickettsiales bacterium]HCX21090.1 hypothetical protein [Cytophagales bacterium]|tara:strand:- start:74 stop:691 length:618 start_codon:yes stop_codon:yes gene_type:complete
MKIKRQLMKYFYILLLLISTYSVHAQKEFQGVFIGLDINYHYLFGGAQVNGRETIGDGNRSAFGLMGGYRWHFANDLVFGMEVQLNKPFGTFKNTSNPAQAIVNYFIKPQSALQFQFGKAVGDENNHLILGYFAFNQTRFDIDITMPDGSKFQQTDFENFGRVGIGYEGRFCSHWSTRFQIGTSMDALPDTHNGIDTKLNLLYGF